MTREEFLKFTLTKQSNGKKSLHVSDSVVDPTFARTGRQMIFEPLNVEYRMKYPDGVPLDKDNPHNIAEFDKIYPDHFKAVREAKAKVETTTKQLKKMQDTPAPQPQQ